MNKYFCKVSAGSGTEAYQVIEEINEDIANESARDIAIQNAESFGYEQDIDHFSDWDTVGKEWDDEEEDYLCIQDLEWIVEEYCPEEHDDCLS